MKILLDNSATEQSCFKLTVLRSTVKKVLICWNFPLAHFPITIIPIKWDPWQKESRPNPLEETKNFHRSSLNHKKSLLTRKSMRPKTYFFWLLIYRYKKHQRKSKKKAYFIKTSPIDLLWIARQPNIWEAPCKNLPLRKLKLKKSAWKISL